MFNFKKQKDRNFKVDTKTLFLSAYLNEELIDNSSSENKRNIKVFLLIISSISTLLVFLYFGIKLIITFL